MYQKEEASGQTAIMTDRRTERGRRTVEIICQSDEAKLFQLRYSHFDNSRLADAMSP